MSPIHSSMHLSSLLPHVDEGSPSIWCLQSGTLEHGGHQGVELGVREDKLHNIRNIETKYQN